MNKQTFEHWTQDEAGVYIGLGYTLQAADTVFKEEMKILWIEHAYFLIVSGVNAEPTHFEVTSHGESMFVCENEENEFPKKITYRLENEQLIAVISDEQNQVVFTFKAQ